VIEHWLNTANRQAMEAAEKAYASTGDMSEALRAAVKEANRAIQARGVRDADILNRDVLNVLYCNRPMAGSTAMTPEGPVRVWSVARAN
jgi:hypothetical protein